MVFALPKLQLPSNATENFNATVALTALAISSLMILGIHTILDITFKKPHDAARKHLRAISIPHAFTLIGLLVLCAGDAYELTAGMDWTATVVHFLGWVIWQASFLSFLSAITQLMRTESGISKLVFAVTPFILGLVFFQITALGYWAMDSPNAPSVLFYTNVITCTVVIVDLSLFLGIFIRLTKFRLRNTMGQERTLGRYGIAGCVMGIMALVSGCMTSFSSIQTALAIIACRALLLIMAIAMTVMKWRYNRSVFIQQNGVVGFSRGYAMDQKLEIDAMEAATVKPTAGIGAIA